MNIIKLISQITQHPLNQNNKVAALIRFLKWQIASRLLGSSIIYEWVNGSRLIVKNGDIGLTGNIYTGLHEFEDMAFLLHFLRSQDCFIDIGANAGSYTVLACAAAGAKGIAFEPIPSTFQRLLENININYLQDRVKCINKGLSDEQGTLAFTSGQDVFNHATLIGENCPDTIMVDVTTLDIALKNVSPVMIKIDVEGFETRVLSGAKEILQNDALKCIIIELNGSGGRYGFNEDKIVKLLYDSNFRPYSYDPWLRRLDDLHGKNNSNGNTLFIRNKDFVVERIASSRTYSIINHEI